MIEMFIAEAETWLGTPFRVQACVKGQGVDCNTLVFESLVSVGIKYNPADRGAYRVLEHLDAGPSLLNILERVAGNKLRKVVTKSIERGDIVIFSGDGKIKHCSIALSPTTHIHVCHRNGVTVDTIEPAVMRCIKCVYRPSEKFHE